MRKIKPPPSGSGSKKKAYYLAEAMQFCLPFIKTSVPPSTGNLPPVPHDNNENTDETILGSELNNDTTIPEHPSSTASPQSPSLLQDNTCRPSPDITNQSHQSSHHSSQPSSIPNLGKKRLGITQRNKAAVEADQCFTEYFKAKKARLESTTSANDGKKEALKMFLLSLVPELEELNDTQIKQFKRKVLNLIDEISAPSVVSLVSPHSSISHVSHLSSTDTTATYYTQFTQDMENADEYFVQDLQ